jgi:plastocyanin
MKKKVFSVFLILFFAIAFASCSSPNTGNTDGNSNGGTGDQTPAVSIENFSFKPSVLTVQKGTTVVWTNNEAAVHNIKSSAFNSPDMKKGETFEFTFETAGTYDYYCGIHPAMTGQIVVVEKSSY